MSEFFEEGVLMQSYKELEVWQRAMDLVTSIYSATKQFPDDERFGLTNQLRRAAVSIPSNIAEGQGRGSTKEFHHFLSISYGSLQEVETQILIAERLNYLDKESHAAIDSQCGTVGRLLNGLKRSLSKPRPPPTDHRQPTTANRQPTTDNH